jgi:membrane associated rhomboid family serine protease
MILPIGDTPNPQRFVAWVTWVLIAICVGIHLTLGLPLSLTPGDPSDPAYALVASRLPPGAAISAWDLFVQHHGYKPAAPSVADLFAAMFLHANFAHLLGNMLFLWIYGDNVEDRLGRIGCLAAWLGTGVVATLAFSAFSSRPELPLIGASGAISGILGAYFVLFPRNLVKVLVGLFPFLFDVWLVPAPIVLGLYLLIDNLLPVLIGGGGSVAHGAHIGGFVAGVAIGWWVGRRGPAAGDRAVQDPAETHLLRAEALAHRGQRAAAYQEYLWVLQHSEDPRWIARARQGLRALELDPRLVRRLGL